MAGEETRPVDVQVGRPTQAPNYVGMYSERVKAALEPYQYLLDYQKELSEDDLRKAQIQNFLNENDLKTKQLNEDVRSHTADETIRTMAQQTNSARAAEEARHNVVDEKHQLRDDLLAQFRDTEIERHNKAAEANEAKTLELTSSLHDSDIKKNDADTEWLQTQTNIKRTEDAQRSDDQQVIQGLNSYVSGIKPEDLWAINQNPEIMQKVTEARGKLHTKEAIQQFDEILGAKQVLGQEIADRNTYDNFSTGAKKAFVADMLESGKDPGSTMQQRWNRALQAGGQIEAQGQERTTWSSAGTEAEQKALAEGKSPQDAFLAGRTAHQTYMSDLKAKEDLKPEPAMVDKLQTQLENVYKSRNPKTKGENNTDYDARIKSMVGTQADLLEQESRVNRPKFVQDLSKLNIDPDSLTSGELQTGQKPTQTGTPQTGTPQTGGSTQQGKSPAKAWLEKLLPGSDQKASGAPKEDTTTSDYTTGGTTSALPASTAFSAAPQYAAAENTDEFSNMFSKLFSAKDTSSDQEETPVTLT